MELPRAVFLIGFMGSGKTTVGRELAHRLRWGFVDLDQLIEARESRTVKEIFQDSGEAGFRKIEADLLHEVVFSLPLHRKRVIAMGGGAFIETENANLLRASGAPVIFLDAPVEELLRRCHAGGRSGLRPLLKSDGDFRRLYDARRTHYLTASACLGTLGKSPVEIAIEIQNWLRPKKLREES